MHFGLVEGRILGTNTTTKAINRLSLVSRLHCGHMFGALSEVHGD